MNEQPYASIVLPVYNQADHIGDIVEAYLSAFESFKYAFEIILVVNASYDDSLQICQEMAKSHPSICVMHSVKPGWGRAVRTGLAAARGQVVCYTNSARTSPYTLVSSLMLAIANPGYVLKTNRRLRYPLIRRIGSGLYNLQCRVLFDLAVWDLNGTPKVFSRDLVSLLDLEEDGDLIDLEFAVKCKKLGLQILELPIVSSARHGGKATTNFYSAFKMYWGAFRMWLDVRKDTSSAKEARNL